MFCEPCEVTISGCENVVTIAAPRLSTCNGRDAWPLMLSQSPPGETTANGSVTASSTAAPANGANGRPRRIDQASASGTSTSGHSFAATAAPSSAQPSDAGRAPAARATRSRAAPARGRSARGSASRRAAGRARRRTPPPAAATRPRRRAATPHSAISHANDDRVVAVQPASAGRRRAAHRADTRPRSRGTGRGRGASRGRTGR